jgi:hypothetical protein
MSKDLKWARAELNVSGVGGVWKSQAIVTCNLI